VGPQGDVGGAAAAATVGLAAGSGAHAERVAADGVPLGPHDVRAASLRDHVYPEAVVACVRAPQVVVSDDRGDARSFAGVQAEAAAGLAADVGGVAAEIEPGPSLLGGGELDPDHAA